MTSISTELFSAIVWFASSDVSNQVLSEEAGLCLAGSYGAQSISRQVVVDVESIEIILPDGRLYEVVIDPLGIGTHSKLIRDGQVGGIQTTDSSIKKYITIYYGDEMMVVLRSEPESDSHIDTWVHVIGRGTAASSEPLDLVNAIVRCP